MSDNLKVYIASNRESFDSFEPGEHLWDKIQQNLSLPAKTKTVKAGKGAWKFGLGGVLAVLVAATFLVSRPSQTKNELTAIPVPKEIPMQDVVPVADMPKEAGDLKNVSPSMFFSAVDTPRRDTTRNGTLPVKELLETTPVMPVEMVPATENVQVIPKEKKLSTGSTDTLFTGIKRLEVEARFCDVSIKTHDLEDVHVKGEIGPALKGVFLGGKTTYNFKFEKTGSILKVSLECDRKKGLFSTYASVGETMLDFLVPADMEVMVHNSSGNISVDGIKAVLLDVSTVTGDISAANISASLRLNTASGNVVASGIEGDVTSRTVTGNHTYENVKGNVNLKTSSGNVTMNNVSGDANVHSVTGDLYIQNLTGNIVAHSSSGSMVVDVSKGNISMKTVTGDILGRNVTLLSSSVAESSSGNIHFTFTNSIEDLSFDLRSTTGDLKVNKNNQQVYQTKTLVLEKGPVKVKSTTITGDQVYR